MSRLLIFLLSFVLVVPVLYAQDEDDSNPENPAAETEETSDEPTEDVAEPLVDLEPVDPGPPLIVIELINDDRILNGVLLDLGDMRIQTAFGAADIPLSKILGIRLARDAADATDVTTIVLRNGDMITGEVNINSLMIQTNWGRSELNGQNLASIFFEQGLAWQSLDLLAGPRWTLIKTEPDSQSTSSTESPAASELAQQ